MMTLRQGLNVVLACSSLMLFAACGDDNDTYVPPAPPTATNTAAPTFTKTNTVPAGNTPTFTPTVVSTSKCGNGQMDEAGETCDDGNNNGGDGCAANCTTERTASCPFGTGTGALIQTGLFALPLEFAGSQTLTAGNSRNTTVGTVSGKTFAPGDIPVVIKQTDLIFDPVMVPGLVCACIRPSLDPSLGPNNSGNGVVGCGDSGVQGYNVDSNLDHNNPPQVVVTSGTGPKGGAVIDTSTSITTISDGGTCATQCIAGNGPDCIPCTDDDTDQVAPSIVTTTTGMAAAHLQNVNGTAGKDIDCGLKCGGADCTCSTEGIPVADCSAIDANPSAAISGVKLVGAFAQLNAPMVGDIVVTTNFVCQ